jgi:hypothetical protein
MLETPSWNPLHKAAFHRNYCCSAVEFQLQLQLQLQFARSLVYIYLSPCRAAPCCLFSLLVLSFYSSCAVSCGSKRAWQIPTAIGIAILVAVVAASPTRL